MDEAAMQKLRRDLLALERIGEKKLAAKGWLDRDVDSLSEKERRELADEELMVMVWRQHVRLFPEWESFAEGGQLGEMSPRAHVATHCAIEAMLREEDSACREQLEELLSGGKSRHEGVHELSKRFLEQMWRVTHGQVDH